MVERVRAERARVASAWKSGSAQLLSACQALYEVTYEAIDKVLLRPPDDNVATAWINAIADWNAAATWCTEELDETPLKGSLANAERDLATGDRHMDSVVAAMADL